MNHPNRLRLEKLEERRLLAADPIITEFMASNNDVLLDGYGASPDWIEVYNRGDQAVDLAGYNLTDDADELDKWEFPSTTIQPGEYLIVFASGVDAIDPAGNLHTNFGLSSEGDYLALANPQGTILSEFGESGSDYPALSPNTSFGLGFSSTFTPAVTPNSSVQYLLPTDGSVDASWNTPGFDDSSWTTGEASLGYEQTTNSYESIITTDLPIGTTTAYVRIPFQVASADAVIGTLGLRYDDGFVAYLNGSPIASSNAPGVVAFDSQATEFRPREAAVEESAFSISRYSNLLQVGENVLAIHLMDATTSLTNDLLLSASLTLSEGQIISPSVASHLIAPTPGGPNTSVSAGDVVFSKSGGVFETDFLLQLTPETIGESIRYTLDGSVPDGGSLLYTEAITINATTQVRARAFGSQGRVGKVNSASFSLATSSVTGFSSDLPIVVLENFGQGVPGRDREPATLAIYETNGTNGRSSLANDPDVTSRIGHNRRGSSTFGLPKASLRIELQDNAGEDQDLALLGMPADSDWILYAPYTTDRSMLRNTVMYDLAGQFMPYSVRTRYVEVYYNSDDGILDQDDYAGVYVLMENIKRAESRIDVEPLTPQHTEGTDLTGGYILKVDRSDGEEDSSWDTSRGTPGPSRIVHVEPNRSEMTAGQVSYIRGYINQFENALNGSNSADPDLGYAAYIDVDSWIDHHLFRVFSREGDVVVLSEHLYKPRDGKLTFGPVWDFDRSSGSESTPNPGVEGWHGRTISVFSFGWWDELFDDPDFKQNWVDRWQELRSSVYSDDSLTAAVYRQADQLDEAQSRNTVRWPAAAPNGGALAAEGLTGWSAEVSHLANWLTGRAAWIDERFATTPALQFDSETSPGQLLLTITSEGSGNPIYYTTDGSDPRADGGGISSSALLYDGPVVLAGPSQVTARSLDSGSFFPWSQATSDLFPASVPADSSNLRISELHYNPLDPTASELLAVPGADNNSFEFVELVNIGSQSIDLTGVLLADGIEFGFSSSQVTSLSPGEVVLVVKNQDAFTARYGGGFLIAGEYDGRLSGGGDEVELVAADGSDIEEVEYDDKSPWAEAPDGDGPSLERIDLLGDSKAAANWRASLVDNGTPGAVTLPLYGDYDRNGIVNQSDRTLWASQYGSTVSVVGLSADGNRDGVINAADYTVWRDNLGATAQPVAALAATTAPISTTESVPVAEERVDVALAGWAPAAQFAPIEFQRLRSQPSLTGNEQLKARDAALLALLTETATDVQPSQEDPYFVADNADRYGATSSESDEIAEYLGQEFTDSPY